jgi:hypothetical protein
MILCPPPSSAQEPRPTAPACWENLAAADTVRVLFEVHAKEHRIWRNTHPAGLSTDYLTSLTEAVAAHMQVPARVDSRVFGVHVGKDSSKLAMRATSATVTFKPQPDGRATAVHLYGVGASPAWERALAQAVLDADSAGRMPPLPPGSYSRDLTLEISADSRVLMETEMDTLASAPVHPGASRRVPIGFAYVERYRLDQLPQPIDRTRRLSFPGAGRAGISDSVAMEFTVDETGRVEMDRAILLSATYVDFVQAVANGLAGMRFEPARAGSCRLRSVVRQSFVFRAAP